MSLLTKHKMLSAAMLAFAVTIPSFLGGGNALYGQENFDSDVALSYAAEDVTLKDSIAESEIFQVAFSECDSDASCCDAGTCDSGCCDSGCCESCVPPWWAHRTSIFGEALFLRPGSTDLIFATEQTDTTSTASPTGPIGLVGIDGEMGFRVGFTWADTQCSSLVASYSRWDGDSRNTITRTGANVLNSNVGHPSVATTGAASQQATARQSISFQLVDASYRRLFRRTKSTALNWSTGIRYGNVEQQLSADQTIAVATGLTNVSTDIDFDGFGITGGLDFEIFNACTGCSLFGRTTGSLMAGEWDATFDQTNQFGGGVIRNRLEDFHVTPVIETELGIRWTGCKRRLQVWSSLLMTGWYEAVTTRSYIDAVRSGEFTDIGETMTFNGMTMGAAWRF